MLLRLTRFKANFHWYVSGPLFCNVHYLGLDEVYGAMYDQLDEALLELILMNDGSPLNPWIPSSTQLFPRQRASRNHRRLTLALLITRGTCALKCLKSRRMQDNFLVSAAMDEHIALLLQDHLDD